MPAVSPDQGGGGLPASVDEIDSDFDVDALYYSEMRRVPLLDREGEEALGRQREGGERLIFKAFAGHRDLMTHLLALTALASGKDATSLQELLEVDHPLVLLDESGSKKIAKRIGVFARLSELDVELGAYRARRARLRERLRQDEERCSAAEERVRSLEVEESGAKSNYEAFLQGQADSEGASGVLLRLTESDWARLREFAVSSPRMFSHVAPSELAKRLVGCWRRGRHSASYGDSDEERDVHSPERKGPDGPNADDGHRELLAGALARLAVGAKEERAVVAELLLRTRPTVLESRDRSSGAPPPRPEDPLERSTPLGAKADPPQRTSPVVETLSGRATRAIGGRRHEQRDQVAGTRRRTEPSVRPSLRPELLCRQAGDHWGWAVVLSVPEALRVQEVRLGDEVLEVRDGECEIPSLDGRLMVRAADAKAFDVALFDGEPLLFKMSGDWEGLGRRVRGVGKGYFLALTPERWRRTGHPPVEPQPCVEGFLAHYFYFDSGDSFDQRGGFEEQSLEPAISGFTLSGIRVVDDSRRGELFVGIPPGLTVVQGIQEVRVGQEGGDTWLGETFDPAAKSLGEVLSGREGWFFIRVYDEFGLRDSGQFRFLRVLRGIRVNDGPYSGRTVLLPDERGHSHARVRLLTQKGLEPDPEWAPQLIRADPDCERAVFRVGTGTGDVEVVVHAPRVWWRLWTTRNEANQWRDVPVELKRKRFLEAGDTGQVLEVRLPRSVNAIRVGFDLRAKRKYPGVLSGGHRLARVPLRDFRDYKAVVLPASKDRPLYVIVHDHPLKALRIWDEQPPTAWSNPRPRVWRQEDGYSPGELEQAGLTCERARDWAIPVAKKRNDVHFGNVDRIGGWLDAQSS